MKTQNNNLVEARKNDRAELVTMYMCTVYKVLYTHTQILQTSVRFLLPSCHKHFKPTIKL